MSTSVYRCDCQYILIPYAGTGILGSSGDYGAATSAELGLLSGIAPDISGNVYICESGTHKIRLISKSHIITTFAGTGTAGSLGDYGWAASAQLNVPWGVAPDVSGNKNASFS